MNRSLLVSGLVTLCATPAFARPLVTTHVDTTPGNTIGTYNYTGAGTGFGGTVGNGTISLDTDNTNLYIRFTAGGGLDNIVSIWLDTKAGGFTDATMSDGGDGSRRALTELAVNTNDAFDPNFLPDFGVTIGNFGTVQFELTAGPINFQAFDGGNAVLSSFFAIPLATLGVAPGGNIDFMVGYISDSGYMSNESIPAYAPLQGNGNPGFGDGQFGGTIGSPGIGNYNRLTTVPTPGSLALLGLAGLTAARRRRA